MADNFPDKIYLGDGAYVRQGSYRGEIELTTENGMGAQNRIVLGPSETATLLRWLVEHGLLDPKRLL